MSIDQLLGTAVANRMAQGLSVETTDIEGRDEPFVYHASNVAERDAYIARCKERGETIRIMAE